MKKIIISGDKLDAMQLQKLAKHNIEAIHLHRNARLETIASELSDVEGYLLGGLERLYKPEFDLMPNLKVIAFVGTGYEAFIDTKNAHSRGVTILNTPGMSAKAVAEYVLALLLSMRRNIILGSRNLSAAFNHKSSELSSCSVGIIGLGAIGTEVGKLLSPLVNKVVGWNRTHLVESPVHQVSRSQVMDCDAIVVALSGNEETKNFITELELSPTSKTKLIINISSPDIINPMALINWLNEDTNNQIAIDGYYTEPDFTIENDPYGLLSHPRVLVTPHIAATTKETWHRMVNLAVDKLINSLGGHGE